MTRGSHSGPGRHGQGPRPAAWARRPPRSAQQSGQKRAGWLVRIVIVRSSASCGSSRRVGAIITSFRGVDDAQSTGWWHVFADPGSLTRLTLSNYSSALNGTVNVGEAFANSFAITLPATIIPIMFAAFGAYAFTFMRFKGREFLFVVIVSMLVVPNQVAFVPLLKIYGSLGLKGTFAAVWLAHAGFAMSLAMYILRNYMATLPARGHRVGQDRRREPLPDVLEARRADVGAGAGLVRDLPVPVGLERPARRAGVHRVRAEPAAAAGHQVAARQQGQGWQLLTAGGVIMMIVPVAVFLALQRFFVRGLTSGAVKG